MTVETTEPRLRPLAVARAERIAADIQLFELRDPNGGDLPEFTPGAHIDVEVPGGLRRKYSLCNDPAERDHYHIAVKREAEGRGGSTALVDEVRDGDTVNVGWPVNDFPLVASPAGYTLIAGGIGITPILSMARHLKATGGRFKLIYLTRSRQHTAFYEELSGPTFRGSVTIHHDDGDPDKAYDLWPLLERPRGHVYCCGPRPLMTDVRDMTGHWSSGAVHFEAFQEAVRTAPDDRAFQVRVRGSDQVVDVPVGVTVLEALRAAGFDVPSSCESGTCGSCKTRLLSGDVEHRDLVLWEGERAGHIMVCVSRARAGNLEIEI